MDRFSELVNQGVAKFNYTNIAGNCIPACPICRSYNNIFSIATDTHMTCMSDGTRVITGHLIHDHETFDQFIQMPVFRGVDFTDAGFAGFGDWMAKLGLEGHYDMINMEPVYIVEQIKK